MEHLAALRQTRQGEIKMTVYRNTRAYTQKLTEEEALELAYKLMSFARGQQDQPFYLMRNTK